MKRWLFNAFAIASALLCIAVTVRWARTYGWLNEASFTAHRTTYHFTSYCGDARIIRITNSPEQPGWHFTSMPRLPVAGETYMTSDPRYEQAFSYALMHRLSGGVQVGEGTQFHPCAYQRPIGRPSGPFQVVVAPFAIPFGFLAAMPLPAVMLQVRRRKRVRNGMCPQCNYDLRATPNVCPECGTKVIQSKRETTVAHTG